MRDISLSGLSTRELDSLSIRSSKMAYDLREQKPSYDLALELGITDISYETTSFGYVHSYRGRIIIVMSNGDRWIACGHCSKGTSAETKTQGFIEFLKLTDLDGVYNQWRNLKVGKSVKVLDGLRVKNVGHKKHLFLFHSDNGFWATKCEPNKDQDGYLFYEVSTQWFSQSGKELEYEEFS